MSEPQIRVGIGVMIWKDGKVLLGKRKGSRGSGEYGFPGGALQYGETLETCANRETREECGITLNNLRPRFVLDIDHYPPTHWVHVGFIADWASGEATVLEPEKCEGWGWYELDQLPTPLFAPNKKMIEAFRTGTTLIE